MGESIGEDEEDEITSDGGGWERDEEERVGEVIGGRSGSGCDIDLLLRDSNVSIYSLTTHWYQCCEEKRIHRVLSGRNVSPGLVR